MDPELLARRRTILNCSRIFIKELTNLLAADRSPICDRRPELITHGFGGIAMLSLLEALHTNISPDAFERKNLCRNECPTLARINMAKFESGDPLIEICPLMVRGIGGYGRGGIEGDERGGVGEYGRRRIGDGPVAAADAQRADTSQSS
uniref:Lipase_3 domain-containing protein n=1 Tax=Globodera pallida TaxID=36090 RepID=A0A183CDY2_GLOPA